MHEELEPRINKWPFFAGDALLLGVAWYFCWRSVQPIGLSVMICTTLCVAGGATLALLPFWLEFRARSRIGEAGALTNVVAQIGELHNISRQIGEATAQWQNTQEQADKTATAAQQIAERMT